MRRLRVGITVFTAALVLAPAALAANFNQWTPAHPLATGVFGHVAVLLKNGQVLVAGGESSGSTCVTTTELYNPATNTWSAAHAMNTARCNAAAVLLPSGKVLVAGGTSTTSTADALTTAEVYDPTANTWTNVTNAMSSARAAVPAAVLLGNGQVLVAGGEATTADPVTAADLYNPATNAFTATTSMGTARAEAIAMPVNGGALVAGGVTGTGTTATATAEVYKSGSPGTWTPVTNSMSASRAAGAAAPLPNGELLVAGGFTPAGLGDTITPTTDLYHAATNNFTAGPSMTTQRFEFGMTALADGRIVVAGGVNSAFFFGSSSTGSTEVYSPASNSWSQGGPLPDALEGLTTTLLPDGQVLAAGGDSSSGASTDASLFTPTAKPSAPLSVSATAGNGSAAVSFAPPASDGGLPLHYTITASSGHSVTTTDARTSATVTGLTNGRRITFTVTAINSLGASPASAASNSVTPQAPDKAPKLTIGGLSSKLKLKAFLAGLKFSVKPNKAASLQITLLGTVNQATIASAYNLTLASKKLGRGSSKRSIKLVPSKRLVGNPHSATVELVIVATDAAGKSSTTTRKIKIKS
jgi:hypothetical protein